MMYNIINSYKCRQAFNNIKYINVLPSQDPHDIPPDPPAAAFLHGIAKCVYIYSYLIFIVLLF